MVQERDLKAHGLTGKDGGSMLTAIIPGPSTIVTFYSQDGFQGLEHTYTENWHAVYLITIIELFSTSYIILLPSTRTPSGALSFSLRGLDRVTSIFP
jgi:hypothetical protein